MDDSIKKVVADYQSKDEKVETDNDEDNLEDPLCLLDITDESSILESEVGKRLNRMVPVPVSAVCMLLRFKQFVFQGLEFHLLHTGRYFLF